MPLPTLPPPPPPPPPSRLPPAPAHPPPFAQEAVAGVDGVGPGDLGGGDEARDLEIGQARGGRADANVVVGEPHVEALAVRLAVDRHGLDPELPARPDHPQGDFPAVRDQDLLEHPTLPAALPHLLREG